MKLLRFTTELLSGGLELQSAWTGETRQDGSLGARSEYLDDPRAFFRETLRVLNKLTLVADHQFTSGFLARAEISPWVFLSLNFSHRYLRSSQLLVIPKTLGLICGVPNREAASSARRFPCST
jgi:hypothetical protein